MEMLWILMKNTLANFHPSSIKFDHMKEFSTTLKVKTREILLQKVLN